MHPLDGHPASRQRARGGRPAAHVLVKAVGHGLQPGQVIALFDGDLSAVEPLPQQGGRLGIGHFEQARAVAAEPVVERRIPDLPRLCEGADLLLGQARTDLAAAGRETLRGPYSPTANHECGLLVDGTEGRPAFLMPWNPAWYVEVYEALHEGALASEGRVIHA